MLPLLLALVPTGTVDPVPGPWRAVLTAPGVEIPFRFEVEAGSPPRFTLRNGVEALPVARVERGEGGLVLHLDPYDSRLELTAGPDGRTLRGSWVRYRGPGRETRMELRAEAGSTPLFPAAEDAPPAAERMAGRWAVTFRHEDGEGRVSESAAVALLEAVDRRRLAGTFLTPLGDYRFLTGSAHGDELHLACFDGAHAFRFDARLGEDGGLTGTFRSRDTWLETWSAVRDDGAELPDDFGLTTVREGASLDGLVFPDLDGQPRRLGEFGGRARLVVLFGSWCPNCGDATDYLRELRERFGERGLTVLGLAFEFGDDLERNARVLRRYAEHKGVDYPILVAGTSDKAAAGEAFPVLDRVRAFPTTLFVDAGGRVRAVHTGFSGPATGRAHERLRERWEALVHELLGPEGR